MADRHFHTERERVIVVRKPPKTIETQRDWRAEYDSRLEHRVQTQVDQEAVGCGIAVVVMLLLIGVAAALSQVHPVFGGIIGLVALIGIVLGAISFIASH